MIIDRWEKAVGDSRGGDFMKISEYLKKTGMPLGTVRFYIQEGLLMPQRKGTQFVFTEQDIADLNEILSLKDAGFSIEDIHRIIAINRFSMEWEPDMKQEYLHMMQNQKQKLCQQIEKCKTSISKIDQRIEKAKIRTTVSKIKTGIPLRAVSLLACPQCGGKLKSKNTVLDECFLYSGTLFCSCGYEMEAENGILKTGNKYLSDYDKPDLNRGMYRDISSAFSTALQKCFRLITERMNREELDGKVILEANINGYFYLYKYLTKLHENCLVILIDKYEEILEMYKDFLEQENPELDILYIADNSLNYPLKEQIVDVVLVNEIEHQLYQPDEYITRASRYFKDNVHIYGNYYILPQKGKTIAAVHKAYPEAGSHIHDIKHLCRSYEESGYSLKYKIVGETDKHITDQYEFAHHVEGELVQVCFLEGSKAQTKG